eukprot:gene13381-14753_t
MDVEVCDISESEDSFESAIPKSTTNESVLEESGAELGDLFAAESDSPGSVCVTTTTSQSPAISNSPSVPPPEPSPTLEGKQTSSKNCKEKILSSRRAKSKKRSRNEVFLSNAFDMVRKQQQAADEHFFKMEDERQKKEFELEEKRRKDEKEHEMKMMQMMGSMFAGIAASFNNIYQSPQSFTSPMQSQAQFFNSHQGPNQDGAHQNMYQQGSQHGPFAHGYVRSVNEQETDNLYTNLS